MISVSLPGRPIRAGAMFLALFAGATSSAFAQKVLLYVANANSNSETEFAISDPGTGALVPFAPKTTNRNPFEVSVSPNGRFLYVGENGAIEVFSIDANGNASPPLAATITGNVSGMAIDSTGKFLFVSNSSYVPPQVETYSIDQTTGQITLVSAYQVAGSGGTANIKSVRVDDSNHLFLAVTNNGSGAGYVQVFNVAPAGSISPISGTSTFAVGSGVLGPNRMALNAGKTLLFTSNQFASSISSFTIGATGALTLVDTKSTGGGSLPLGIAVDPVANVVLVVNNLGTSNNVLSYTFAGGGALTAGAAYSAGSHPTGVTIDPTGQNAYVSNTNDNTVTRFSVNSSGVLSAPLTTPTGGTAPQFLLARFPPAAATVPTLSTWGIAVLGMLLAAVAALTFRRTARQS